MLMTFLYLAVTVLILGASLINIRLGLRMYVITFLLVQPYMRINLGSISIPLQALLCGIITFTTLGYAIYSKRFAADLKSNIHNRAVLIICFILLLTVIFNPSVVVTNGPSYVYFIFRKIFLIYIGWLSFNDLKIGNKMMKYFLIIFVVILCYGVYEAYMQANPIVDYLITTLKDTSDSASFPLFNGTTVARGYKVQTIFYHAYAWGGTALVVGAIFLYLSLNTKNKKAYYKYTFVFFMVLINIFFTRGRSSIIPEALLVCLAMVLKSGNLTKKIKLVLPALFLPLFVAIFAPKVIDSISDYFSVSGDTEIGGSSVDMREGQFVAAYVAVKDKPFTGNGFEYTRYLLKQIGGDTDLESAEGFWLVILIDNGLLGVAAYLIFFFLIFTKLLWIRRVTKNAEFGKEVVFVIITFISYCGFITLTGEMNTIPLFCIMIGVISKYLHLQSTYIRAEHRKLQEEEYIKELEAQNTIAIAI